MARQASKSAARSDRRTKRPRNDEALMRLAAKEGDFERPQRRSTVTEIKPLNDAQRRYDAAMRTSDVVFGVGPAGTGKTWLAVMRAAQALKDKQIEKIVLTRPAVEAGESLGFLPGELHEKYEPYIRPVRDALEEFFGSSHLEYLLKTGAIEPRPLAFLRGSTMKNAWLIADEMQNATQTQFKMLLTRIGEGAKFIINGDPDQTDLHPISSSGLADAVRRVRDIHEVSVVDFTRDDIVRHGLVQKFVDAYSSAPSNSRYNDSENDNSEGLSRFINASRGATA